MKIIRESLNFERGLEPKDSMDIGKSRLDREIMEETDWAINLEKNGFLWDIIELIRDYRGYPILILKNKQQESWPYRAISRVGVFGDYQPTPEKALLNLQKAITREIQKEDESHASWKSSLKKNESQNFERGIDPKKSMRIGEIDLINRIDWDVNIHHVNFTEPTEIIKFIRDYKGFPIVIVKWHGEFEGRMRDNYFGVSSTSGMGRSGFTDSPLRAERNVKRLLDNRIKRSYNK